MAAAAPETVDKKDLRPVAALLEIGSDSALRLLMKYVDDVEVSLTTALSRCTRPDSVVIRLLRFGLADPARIYQCLSILKTRPNAEAVVNTPEVGKAQVALLQGAPNAPHIKLLTDIGFSITTRTQLIRLATQALQSFLSDVRAIDKFLKSVHAVRLLVSEGQKEGAVGAIASLDVKDWKNGQALYTVLASCKALDLAPPVRHVAIAAARRSIELGYFSLAAEFLKRLDLKAEEVVSSDLLDDIQLKSESGSISGLIEISELMPHVDLSPLFRAAVDIQLRKKNVSLLAQNFDAVEPYLAGRELEVATAIAVSAAKMDLTDVQPLIQGLGLEDAFQRTGVITRMSNDERYGTMVDILTQERLFYHVSNFEKKPRRPPSVGSLVRYKKAVQGKGRRLPAAKGLRVWSLH